MNPMATGDPSPGWGRYGKKTFLAILVPVLALGWLFWFSPGAERPGVRTTTRLLMGTLVSISTWGVPPQREERAVVRAFDEMARIEKSMGYQKSEGLIARINAGPRGQWHDIPEELAALLRRGLAIGADSGGAFDMGLAPLTRLWGFSRQPAPMAPPDDARLDEWVRGRRQLQSAGIELSPPTAATSRVRLLHDSVGLDLGGIAKGYAIDRALLSLRRDGLENVLINAGGDLRALGGKGGKPWRIGIQHPRQTDQVIAVSHLHGKIHGETQENLAMVTSGDYERFFVHDGRRYHHILNPHDGRSARSGLASVSVQAADALTADVLCTAIFVLGGERGVQLLKKYPGVEALLIFEDGHHRQTPGFVGDWLPAGAGW